MVSAAWYRSASGSSSDFNDASAISIVAAVSSLPASSASVRGARTEALLAGRELTAATIEIALASLKSELDPLADLYHAAETKRHLAVVLARRLLTAAHASRVALAA